MPSPSTEPQKDKWAVLHSALGVAESGGEENNTATDFARHWAIAHIAADLSDTQNDYLVIFEYLQDIAVLDSSDVPTKICLYQLKKRTRAHWTKSSLTSVSSSKEKGEKPKGNRSPKPEKQQILAGKSILGKLYYAVHSATSLGEASGILLTDGHFDLIGPDTKRITSYSKTKVDELAQSDADYISTRLQKELGFSDLKHLGSLHLEQSRMNPAGMREYVRGVLADFLERRFPDRPNISGTLMEKMLDRFGRLSGLTPACNSLAELAHHKGFTKAQFIALVQDTLPVRTWDQRLDVLAADLKDEGVQRRLVDRWSARALTVHTGHILSPQRSLIYDWKLAERIARDSENSPYRDTVEKIVAALKMEALTLGQQQLDNVDLAAVALVAILNVNTESTSTDQELTEGQQ